MAHTFYRDPERKLVAGICGALATKLNIEVTWLRLAVALIALFTGGAVVWAYLILWAITPLGASGQAPVSRFIDRAAAMFRPSRENWPERM